MVVVYSLPLLTGHSWASRVIIKGLLLRPVKGNGRGCYARVGMFSCVSDMTMVDGEWGAGWDFEGVEEIVDEKRLYLEGKPGKIMLF